MLTQDGGPRRPKIAPRRVQDRLGSAFLTLALSHRFCIFFGSVLVPLWAPKWVPRGGADCAKRRFGDPRRSRDRLGSILFSSCGSRSLLLPSWAPFGVVCGCSWGRFGAFWGFLRCLNRRFVIASSCLWFRCVRCCFVLVFVVSCSLTHLLINPWPFGTF